MSIGRRQSIGRLNQGLTPRSAMAMVQRFTRRYGVPVSWVEPIMEENSRGYKTATEGEVTKLATVLILKERFNPLNPQVAAFGLTQDYTRYILTLPNIGIAKDIVITDNHGLKWRVGVVDWFDVGGVAVAKQAKLTEVT